MGDMANPKREKLYVHVTAPEVAVDALMAYGFFEHGLFVVSTDEVPAKLKEKTARLACYWGTTEITEEMLARAEQIRREYMTKMVKRGDKDWARKQIPEQIDDIQRASASFLGLQRDWNYDVANQINCSNCNELMSPVAAACPKCNLVRDWKKAVQLGIRSVDEYEKRIALGLIEREDLAAKPEPEPVPQKRGPGRPRKEVQGA